MQLADSRLINAKSDLVWVSLLDAEVLKACVPGCQEMTGTAEDGFEAVVVQKVGPVKATFKGAVQLSDMVKAESLTISGEGKGGAAGFAKGGAKVRLEAQGEQTVLHYEVEAKVGGKLATMPTKISREIPLPIPRAVICSPSHIKNTVPPVNVTIVVNKNSQPGSETIDCPLAAVNPWSAVAITNDWPIANTTVR